MADTTFALIREMNETPDILRRFDPAAARDWARDIGRDRPLLLTGEGSSRIFPAKNMISQALARGLDWRIVTEGARQAMEYDLSAFQVIGASNSGQTRELIALVEQLQAQGLSCHGLTSTPDSALHRMARTRVLSCGREQAIAASKSVIEQALNYQALLNGTEWQEQARAADVAADILSADLPADIADLLQDTRMIYLCGRNDGVAEELSLKTNEIARVPSAYLEGTYLLHGVEEVMQAGETVILIEPFAPEIAKYQTVLSNAGVKVIAIAAEQTPFPTLPIPALRGFDGYFRVMAGWRLLVAAGLARGVDLDKTRRARKIGNAV